MELATEYCIQGRRDSKWPQKGITVQSPSAARAAMVTCGHLTTKQLMRFAPISAFHFLFVTAQGYVALQR